MVFQGFNLFPHKTMLQNITLAPMVVKGISKEQAEENAIRLLKKVGLEGFANRYPATLSGGQSQRAAIARALAMNPKVMLYDEPTSALDIAHQVDVLALIQTLSREHGLTVITVLHDINMAARYCDHLVALRGGGLIAQGGYRFFFLSRHSYPHRCGGLRFV